MRQEVGGCSGCGARRGGGLLLCNKTEQKQKYAVWRRALANSRGEQSRGPALGSVCARGSLCACAYMLIEQKPSGIQSPSDKMKIILFITMEALIKTAVCNYSRPAPDNGDTLSMNLHTDTGCWHLEWPVVPTCSESICCSRMSVPVISGLLTWFQK